jgi:DNA invertase Pin-like site-specific DNA recombinase
MNARHRGKFVAYYRVSAESRGRTGVGLDAQRKAVKDYLNGGLWELVAEFTEVEPRQRIKRPELAKALTACRKLRARLVIAKLNRLSRSVAFMVTLMDSDVDFIAVDKPHVNRLTIHDLARVAQDAREVISERTKAALAAVKASGKKLGTRNPNRLVKRMAKARKAKADQFAASVLPMIRAIEALGWTSNASIAAQLNARNVPTAWGKKWTHVQVGQVRMRDRKTSRRRYKI